MSEGTKRDPNFPDVLFKEYPEERRAAYLDDHCRKKIENSTFTRKLSPEETKESKDLLFRKSIEIRVKNDAMAKLKKEHNAAMKILKGQVSECLTEIEFNQKTEIGDVYEIDNQKEGLMYIYNATGHLVSTRPLIGDEIQMHLVTSERNAI